MSKIDFDKIIGKVLKDDNGESGHKFTVECMKEACRQVLDEAAERAEAVWIAEYENGDGNFAGITAWVDPDSILSIKEGL